MARAWGKVDVRQKIVVNEVEEVGRGQIVGPVRINS